MFHNDILMTLSLLTKFTKVLFLEIFRLYSSCQQAQLHVKTALQVQAITQNVNLSWQVNKQTKKKSCLSPPLLPRTLYDTYIACN